MKEILERLKFIRFHSKMNQTEFAKVLKIVQNSYSQIETGKNALTDKNIALICLTFGVNEDWLRTGRGEIYNDRQATGTSTPISPQIRHSRQPWENHTSPSSTFEPLNPQEPQDDESGAADSPGSYKDEEPPENNNIVNADIYEINSYNLYPLDNCTAGNHSKNLTTEIYPLVASTTGDYAKSLMNKDISFLNGRLHIDKTNKDILFAYSYDKYYEEGEIPFHVCVYLYRKEDKKPKLVRINRIQVQDKDYDKLVMISDDIEYNTRDSFRIKLIRTK
jgi:transcriptional regulator with XRE-family HTH domain